MPQAAETPLDAAGSRESEAGSELAVIIPAYNVSRHLNAVLAGLAAAAPGVSVIVVDDGSDDDTHAIAGRFTGKLQVHCVRHKKNRGKGAAIASGIAYIVDHVPAQAIVFMDGDGQHRPEDMPRLWRAWREGGADLIIGARSFSPRDMPLMRIASNTLTSLLLTAKLRTRIRDSQSGFRLMGRRLAESLLPLAATGYDIETEMLIRAVRAGARVGHVPVATVYGEEKSHIRGVRDTYRIVSRYLRT